MQARGLILAAPASGNGKTLVTAGLLRHLRRRDVRVAAAKTGPDFIDPTFHALASGAPCINLDPWAMRPETLAGLVAGLEAAAEIVLCEGVMGLFDGTGADGEAGSTAELARITGWPVVLVVDARGQGASVAALLRGFTAHRPEAAIAGVIFNRVASERHRALLAGAVMRHLPDLAILGALPADPALALPSRHLGLVPAGEIGEAERVIERAAEQAGAKDIGGGDPAGPQFGIATRQIDRVGGGVGRLVGERREEGKIGSMIPPSVEQCRIDEAKGVVARYGDATAERRDAGGHGLT